jgi:hypothetical protein
LVAERAGKDLMPELGYRPVNKYLPPRHQRTAAAPVAAVATDPQPADESRLWRWVDRLLSR